MRKIVIVAGSVIALFGAANNTQAAGCDEFKKAGALHVETDAGILENFRLPIFTWPACEGATNYNIYVNDQLQGSVQGVATWQPTTEYAYGSYIAYVVAVYADGSTDAGQRTPFRIGIAPPSDLQPNHQGDQGIWKQRVTFTFKGSRGAMAYGVTLARASGDAKLCEFNLPAPEGRDGVEVKTYTCEMPEGMELDPGEQVSWRAAAWTVVDGIPTNIVESEKANVKVRKLTPPINLECKNGYSTVVRSDIDKPGLKWTHELLDAGEDVVLELYFINPETNDTGEPDPTKDVLATELNATTTDWRDVTKMDGGEEYRWYVVAKKEKQQATGEVWVFSLNEPIGLGIGIKLGGNGLRTTNPLSQLRLQPGGGLYVDQRLVRAGKFTLKAQLDLLLEGRAVGFDQQDNPEFIVEDLHFTNLVFAPGLSIKPMFQLFEPMHLYALVGAELVVNIVRRIINDSHTEKVVDQVNMLSMDVFGALGVEYAFDVKYLFGRNLQLGAEFRYTHGLFDHLNGRSFVGFDKSLQTEFSFFITNRIIDF